MRRADNRSEGFVKDGVAHCTQCNAVVDIQQGATVKAIRHTKKTKTFLLKVTWQDQGVYKHDVLAREGFCVEDAFEALAKEHPEWEEYTDPYDWGHMNSKHLSDAPCYTNVAAFEVVRGDWDSWGKWRSRQIDNFKQRKQRKRREEDMEELARIVNEWGVSALELLATAAEDTDG